MGVAFGPRRGIYIDITEELKKNGNPLGGEEVNHFETFDIVYRSLCALMFNYVPLSGHPGGSISSGRFVTGLLFDTMDYDVSDPDRKDADIISYSAGHKALGLYAMWALRNEVIRIGAPGELPQEERYQLRLEDLLGFRRNPETETPLFKKFNAKPLDGHPTPSTPFVKLSTGASGVGVATSIGLAFGALDYFGDNAPRVHVVEGEGGMTPGRVSEAFASAGTSCLKNVIFHIDWNQASIDSNRVCREDETPGEYVQWTPMEFAYLHDWNVIMVPDGRDFQQIIAAQRLAKQLDNEQPTAIVYKTTKGWQYGIEGRASHGAGHKLCTDGFFEAASPLLDLTGSALPSCETDCQRCEGGSQADIIEACFYDALMVVRSAFEEKHVPVEELAKRLLGARDRLNTLGRMPRKDAPNIDRIFEAANSEAIPGDLVLKPGASTTLRGELGRVLNHYNKLSGGAIVAASADLLGSTSVLTVGKGFPEGFYNSVSNPYSRILSCGGICEDAMTGILSGMSSYGSHVGAGSSYGAFIAALGHIASRLHAIGGQAKKQIFDFPYQPFILICAHAGVKTGEDGPTHADPQPLQLLQENFPRGTMITLTPWDPQEIWTLMTRSFKERPCVIAPFVTRPTETIIDRKALGLAPATDTATGVYKLRSANGKADGALVLQGSEVAYAFIEEAMPLLEKKGIDLDVYYVSSAELFDMLPTKKREKIFPAAAAETAMGITGFTLPTMYRWIRSDRGRAHTMYPFQKGHFLGSGQAEMVLKEAGLGGASQFKEIVRYLEDR